MIETSDAVLISDAAIKLRISRERLIRRVQLGAIAGGKNENGQWYVERAALDEAIAGKSRGLHAVAHQQRERRARGELTPLERAAEDAAADLA